jgi:para-aminobenzoate synthetase component 1
LSPLRRSVYRGAIAYLGDDGTMDITIAIRTLVHSAGVIRLWAGGGIVVHSNPEAEYRETCDMSAILLELLERLTKARTGRRARRRDFDERTG